MGLHETGYHYQFKVGAGCSLTKQENVAAQKA
jgi:hypothetical protein